MPKKPKLLVKLRKQEKLKKLDKHKNKLPLKLLVKHRNKPLLPLNKRNNKNKLLVDIKEIIAVDGTAQMDNTLQKLKLLQQVFLGKQFK